MDGALARAASLPIQLRAANMPTITFELDEDYPFHLEDSRGYLRSDARLEIAVYGKVKIAYRADDDWYVEAIELSASNGKIGKDCEGWEQDVSGNHPMFRPIERYLQEIRADDVSAAIREQIKDERDSRLFDEGKERAKLRGAA